MDVYPRTEGFGYLDIGFSQEMALQNIIERTFSIEEAAKDFLINFEYEVAEGISARPINSINQIAKAVEERVRVTEQVAASDAAEPRYVALPSISLAECPDGFITNEGWKLRRMDDYMFLCAPGASQPDASRELIPIDAENIALLLDGTSFILMGVSMTDGEDYAIPVIAHLPDDAEVVLIETPYGLTIRLAPPAAPAPASTLRPDPVLAPRPLVDELMRHPKSVLGISAAIMGFLVIAFMLSLRPEPVPEANLPLVASVEEVDIATPAYMDDLRAAIDQIEAKSTATE
jgi:hypothetical protein